MTGTVKLKTKICPISTLKTYKTNTNNKKALKNLIVLIFQNGVNFTDSEKEKWI